MKISTTNTILSAQSGVYKTERFVKATKVFVGLDFVLEKIAGEVLASGLMQNANKDNCFCINFDIESLYSEKLYFCFNNGDFVFNFHTSEDKFIRRGDMRFSGLIASKEFNISINPVKNSPTPKADLIKLYRISSSDYAHFPLLDPTQRKIVTTEDEHMLVQGVAGSGKTNLCIDKILYASLRGYAGKSIYSTYSRGLLNDTKLKVSAFSGDIKRLVSEIEKGIVRVIGDVATAIEKKFGFLVACDNLVEAKDRLVAIAKYLDERVDYYLIEDLYRLHLSKNPDIAFEDYFVKTYTKDIKNHQLSAKLSKISYLSYEVLYKEIYGLVFGASEPTRPLVTLTQNEYTERRKGSFSNFECETIYSVAMDYKAHLQKTGLVDNNIMSRALIEIAGKIPTYSLCVLDEVQDFTEVNLVFFKKISRKMFCVGDALQMINPSYFSFSYLKRLLYEKDISSSAELVSNYRSSKKIADISEKLGTLNAKYFGVHRFLLRSKAIDDYAESEAIFIEGSDFLTKLASEKMSNYTVVVSNNEEKIRLRKLLEKPEILTVSEAKGLERDTIILSDVLSSNLNRWEAFRRAEIDKKTADENSVYRYYFNLLYVGISRAKHKLLVLESKKSPLFEDFFNENFSRVATEKAIENLLKEANQLELEQDELIERVAQFIGLGQYDNARFSARNILVVGEREAQLNRIDVAEKFISKGLHKEAGIAYLRYALYSDAKEQFILANDEVLVKLAETCLGSGGSMGLEVLDALIQLDGNNEAQGIIIDLVKQDLVAMKETAKNLSQNAYRTQMRN